MPQKRQPSIWDEVDQAIAPAAPAAAAPSVWDDVDQALGSAPPTIGQRQFPKGASAGGTTTAVPAPFSMSGPDAIPVGPQSVLDRLGHRPEPLNPPPSMLDIVKGTAFRAAQQIPRTPQQVGPAAMKAVSAGMDALSGAATSIPTAIGETIAGQPLPGHQGEPDSFLGRLAEHATMILGGNGGQVNPIGIVKATVNPPDSSAPTALGFKGSASMQSPVRSPGESIALETGRRGLDMVARLVSDPAAVATVGLPGVAGQALGLFFTAQGVQAAAETAANPNATPEDVAESLVNAAVLTGPLALHAAVPRLRAAIRAGGDWGRARQMESVPWAPGQGPRAAERALTPEVPELPAVGESGIPSPTGSSPVGAPSAPIPVTPRAPEPSPVWDAVDQAIAQTPTPPADQGPPIVLPPVAVRPGGTAGAPVAPSPELPPVVPSAEPSPIWQAVDEAIAQPTDTSGRELGGYAGPERRTETRVSTPEEDARYTRMREKLAAGEPTGTEESRQVLAEKQRVEDYREQAAVDEVRQMEPKPDREFSSTQIELPQEHADALRALAAKIPDEHLAEDGREDHPHVTVKFGLHTNDAEDVRKVLADEPPIKVRLGKTSLFPAKEGADYDVVKADVDSPDLHRLNAKIAAALEHTDTHPEYKPHATLAYVKPGLGKKYEGDASLEGREMTVSVVTFSGKDRKETTIPLAGASDKPGDVWQQVDQAIAPPPAPAPVGKFADLSTHERRELRRIQKELENYGYEGKTRTIIEGGPKGKEEIWTAGHGGAPVYGDIQDGASGKRASVEKALANYINGGKPSKIAERAVSVARRRLAGDVHLSTPILPPDAGDEPGAIYVTRRTDLPDDEARVQNAAADVVERDPQGAIAAYRKQFGKVVNADLAKEIVSPEYAASKDNRARYARAVQGPSSALARAVYRQMLDETRDKPGLVVFTAGGTGSGKSSSLDVFPSLKDDAEIVYDSTLASKQGAGEDIQAALGAGKEVGVLFTYRPAEKAFRSVLTRAGTEGRTVTVGAHARTHARAIDVVRSLVDRYRDDDRVMFSFVDNSGDTPDERGIADASVLGQAYNVEDVQARLRTILEEEHAAGHISDAIYQGSLGTESQQGAREAVQGEVRAGGDAGRREVPREAPSARPVNKPTVLDTLNTGEKQARLPGAESARQARKASTSFKAPQQASGEDFALGAETTPEAEAKAKARENPSLLPVTPRSESASIEIPSTRPYLTADMKPSEMMRAYVKATWGEFGQRDLIDAVVGATGFKNFVPGKSTRRGDKATLSEQKHNVLKWMDWSDAGIAEHEKSQSELPVTPKASAPESTPSAVLPITPRKSTLDAHDDFIVRLRKGKVTPYDLKAAFEQALSDKPKLLAQLSAMTKDELLKRFGRMGAARYKSEKKAAIVDAAYRDILQDFVLANSLSYNPMSNGGFEAAVRAQVENATEADIAAYAKRVTEAIDAHKKRVEGYVKAIKNPETLEEFDTFVRANKNGEAGLTDAQRVTYDELRARAGREVRQRDDAKKATVQAASETVATTITETTHTKKGYPLFVVQLAKRVERDDYTKLNLAAKKLGGWYSSFRGNGATPGFQFKTKEAAEAFQKLATEGDTSAVKDAAIERRETRREEKKNAAAERLADMADRLEASANESLSADRLANTARRARMAESADASARADLAMARTLRNLAEAIESGEATHLDGIRTKTQIEGLDKIATQAKYDAIRERSPEYRDFEKEKDRAVTAADIDHATYPAVTATRADLLSAATAFKGRRVATRLTALAKRTSGDERIEVPWDVVAEAVAVDEELGKRGVLPWIWASRQTDHRRLETAGIPDLPTLRAALREFIQYRGAKPEGDKVKTLERELAGERGVGIDFFPTPEDLALRMAEALDVQKGMTVLEPSAGKGNLADAVRAVNSDAVIHVVEIAPKLRAILEAKGYHIAGQDFTGFAGEQDREERYDRVIMNPPFSNGQDADHVRRAFDLLKPGGRLVAITGDGIFFRSDKKATAFRAWFDNVGGTSEKLEGAFTDRREVKTTGVASRLLVVNKPEAQAKSEKGGGGNVSAESFRSPTRRPFNEPPRSPIPVTGREVVRPSDLVRRVSDLFGKLPIKTKRFRDQAFGIYKKKEQVVRLKVENDLATLSHELGHHIDLAIFGDDLPYDLYRDELLRLGANTSRGRDSAQTKLREGAAEFFRLYVSNPKEARRQAPTYYRAFTDALAKSDWADAIKETQKLFQDYLAQDLATRGEARIDFTGGQPDTLFKQIASDPRGFVDRMATAWVDDLRAAQRVVEALEKDSGEPIDALESAYVLARLARGAAGKAEGFLHYGPRAADGSFLSGSLHDALEPVAKRLEDFSKFLVALRVVELRGRGIETGISFPEAKAILDRSVAPGYVPAVAALEATRAGEKTGLTLEQAEAAVQAHIKTGFKEFEKARVAVYAYQDAVLRYASELGALSGDQIKAIRAVNRFYVPFQRVLEATESGLTGTAKRLADRALPVKRIRGSGKDIINPLESIIKNTFATVDMVEKNRAMLALVDQAMEIKGSGKYIERIPAPQVATQFNLSQVAGAVKKALEEEGVDLSEVLPNGGQLELDELVTVFTPAQFAGKGSGIVSVIRNGKREWYSVNDKDLYDAITAVGPQIAGWVKALSGPASWLRAGATLTLGFVARNPVRDTFVAAVQSQHGFVPVVDTVRGLFSYLKADTYYQDFLNSGAANSALVSRDRDQIRTALRKMVDRKWIPRNPIEILRALSEATEMATRVGEFRRGVLREGRTPEGKARAALGARDVTMDFARAGSVGRQVNQFAAFFNARLQGYSRMVDLAKEDARRARSDKDPNPFHYASGRAAIYLSLFSALVWKLNQDDRDYEEIPDWEKAAYWHIPIPGGWIRVPKPFEWGTIFGSTTEAALNYIKTKDPQKLRNLFPDGPGPTLRAAALSIMPVAIMPWVEIWSNYDLFRDRNIVSPYDTDLPPELQYSRWTSSTAKTLGKVMGVSPSKIDHIAYGYFAGLGRAAMEAPSVLARLSGQSSAPAEGASDLPVVGTFFKPRTLSAQATSLQDLYDFSERLAGAKRGMQLYAKRGDNDRVQEIRQTLGPIVAGRPSLDAASQSINAGVRELKELRPQIDAIFASKTLTPQQKREQLDRVYEEMVQTARTALGRPPLERQQKAVGR